MGAAIGLGLIVFGAYATFFWVLLPLLGLDPETARQQRVQEKLGRIATALREYHADYGRLPPPYTVDANGTPMHSWRAAVDSVSR